MEKDVEGNEENICAMINYVNLRDDIITFMYYCFSTFL